jgi:spore coat polysaccharide biosynthesis predicted glycosyltransferase SpsG
MNIFILTEGSSRIGFGHITRCLSLYDALEDIGCKVGFVVNGDSTVGGLFESRDHKFLDWAEERNESLKLLDGADAAIIDSYLAGRTYYEEAARAVRVPVYIDDTKRIDYPGGVVVNGTIFAEKMGYPVRDDITYLLGSRYTPLRKEFWEVPDREIRDEPKTVMVTFGGEDAGNLTPSVLKLLKKEFPALDKKVVIGKGYGNREEIEREGKDGKTELLYNLDAAGMRDLMLKSDIAVSACGQTLCELARVGVPTVAVAVAENQLHHANGWREAGFIEYAGWREEDGVMDKLKAAIIKLSAGAEARRSAEAGKKHIDGQGSKRIAEFIKKACEN